MLAVWVVALRVVAVRRRGVAMRLDQRDRIIERFRTGEIWVLICTDLMARGIDFKGVNMVINYDFPQSAVSYIHRIGRTGRAGRGGVAVTLFTESDMDSLRSIANVIRQSGCKVPAWMLSMKRDRRSDRRKLESRAPRRDSVSTVSKYDAHKAEASLAFGGAHMSPKKSRDGPYNKDVTVEVSRFDLSAPTSNTPA
eukprot:jgi/Undpi1/12342/HiC_scaffold_5.g02018.m1